MSAVSILYERGAPPERGAFPPEPDCFRDLNLDAVFRSVSAGKEEYGLMPLYHSPLSDASAVRYRQEVAADLARDDLLAVAKGFAIGMRLVRDRREQAGRLHDERQKDRWFLDEVAAYCDLVAKLDEELSSARIASRGLSSFRDYLRDYARSSRFVALRRESAELGELLETVRYCVFIKDRTVRVQRLEGEDDYADEIERVFAKFSQGAGREHLGQFSESRDLSGVETKVLDAVARLYPEAFERLGKYRSWNASYADEGLVAFDRELQFYVAYLDYIAPLRKRGLRFCFPVLSASAREESCAANFDLALADKLAAVGSPVVANDFALRGKERVIVVTGPNQGGKTTFARAFGQAHYLARLGLPVPGSGARMALCDEILTHFERGEDALSGRGKLEDDLERIRATLDRASGSSLVILNEIFTSTSLCDAVYLGERILSRIEALGATCVCVTFMDELADEGKGRVSMMSEVDRSNPDRRTYKVRRAPPDGLAYALSIAARHGLAPEEIAARIGR
jgi:Mismatch repair ATPase (MutS family)